MKITKIFDCTGCFRIGGVLESKMVIEKLRQYGCDMAGENIKFLDAVMRKGGVEFFGKCYVKVDMV